MVAGFYHLSTNKLLMNRKTILSFTATLLMLAPITSPCQTIKATPGVYEVYVTAWGKKSNTVTFTVK